MKYVLKQFIWSVVILALLSGCSTPFLRVKDRLNPLIEANCPSLTPLVDDTFAATTLKLVEVAGQYNKCREAALTEGSE